MNPFSKPPAATPEPAAEKACEWPARLEALAVEAEPAALRRAPEILKAAQDDHAADVASYAFDCRRHGDFLSVFIDRLGREGEVSKESTTLNLGQTRDIRLREGHGPDNAGTLAYRFSLEREEPEPGLLWCSSGAGDYHRVKAPPAGYHYEVTPEYPGPRYWRHLIQFDSNKDGPRNDFYDPRDSLVRHRTPNYPRWAADDLIEFSGIGATIYAPAGQGQIVLDRILKVIGKAA
jgi:hypothetical protein